jgi:hypothetical protein
VKSCCAANAAVAAVHAMIIAIANFFIDLPRSKALF